MVVISWSVTFIISEIKTNFWVPLKPVSRRQNRGIKVNIAYDFFHRKITSNSWASAGVKEDSGETAWRKWCDHQRERQGRWESLWTAPLWLLWTLLSCMLLLHFSSLLCCQLPFLVVEGHASRKITIFSSLIFLTGHGLRCPEQEQACQLPVLAMLQTFHFFQKPCELIHHMWCRTSLRT